MFPTSCSDNYYQNINGLCCENLYIGELSLQKSVKLSLKIVQRFKCT